MNTSRGRLGAVVPVFRMRGLSILLPLALLAAFGGSRAHAADQWFDSGTASGIQPSSGSTGDLVWADSPSGSNMWAYTSAGTNIPQLWDSGNNAFFSPASSGTATVTVNGAIANNLLFSAGAWVFKQGTGPLTINGGGLTNITTDAVNIRFETDLTLGANQTWYQNAQTITVTGKISGASYTLTKTGAGTLTLTNAANEFAGLVLKAGTVTAYNNSLGGSSANLTLGGTDADSRLVTVNLDTSVAGNNTFTNGNLTVAGGHRFNLKNTVTGSTNILRAATLGRTGRATFGLVPSSATALGTNNNQVFFTGVPADNKGMLPPWVMSTPSGASPTFTSNDTVRGLVPVIYDTGGWTSDKKISATNFNVTVNTNAYALQVVGVSTNNATLTLGDGQFAGLTMNNNKLVGSGTLEFGAAELIVGIGDSGASRIGNTLSGSGGLTLNNPLAQTLVISNMTYTGDTWINGGTLQVALTDTTTYTNAINGLGGLSKAGPGTLILAGDSSSFNGAVDVSGGPLVFSNANFRSGGAVTIGNVASNCAVTVLSNSTWNLAWQTMKVGDGAVATGNVLTVNAGTVTNAGVVTVGGSTAGATGNSLIITNGGVLFGNYVFIGDSSANGTNTLTVGGPGPISYLTMTNGSSGINFDSGSGNTMTATNAVIFGPLQMGYDGSSDNTVKVLKDTVWNMNNGPLRVGYGGSGHRYRHVMVIDGGVVSNVGYVVCTENDNAGTRDSSLTVTNGGKLFVNGVTYFGAGRYSSNNTFNVGGLGASCIVSNGGMIYIGRSALEIGHFSTMNVTNANLWSAGLMIGGGTGSIVNVYADTTWNLLNSAITVGTGITNALNIYAGIITNINGVTVSGWGTTMTVTNARLWGGGVIVGTTGSGGSNNTVNVLKDTVWDFKNAALTFGSGSSPAAISNVFVVNGGVVTNVSGVVIGDNSGATRVNDNSLTVVNGGQLFVNGGVQLASIPTSTSNNSFNVGGWGAPCIVSIGGSLNVGGSGLAGYYTLSTTLTVTNATLRSVGGTVGGQSSTNCTAWVRAGGYWSGGVLTVGSGVSTGNMMFVQSGGILEADTLAIGAGGNLITNSYGIYQFTNATPTITTNGNTGGSIAIDNGTISFRDVTSGLNLTNNTDTTRLGRLVWSGNNTLRLNNSTATNTVAAGYTFQTGNPVNYSRLEMINGTTRIRGKGITIGSTGGSILFSNTTATIDGAFTNNGTMTVVDSLITFGGDCTLQGGSILWSTNAASSNLISVAGALTTSGSISLNVTGATAGNPAKLTLFDVTGAISDSAVWTVLPDNYRIRQQGTTLSLVMLDPGTVFSIR